MKKLHTDNILHSLPSPRDHVHALDSMCMSPTCMCVQYIFNESNTVGHR
jgi:hypothetical protein